MKDAIIKITSRQNTCGEDDIIEITTRGLYDFKNGQAVVKYIENSGILAGAETTLKITPNEKVEMTRKSPPSEITVEKNKRHQCLYTTQFGEIVMGVFGTKVKTEFTPQSASIHYVYTIDFDAEMASINDIAIEISF